MAVTVWRAKREPSFEMRSQLAVARHSREHQPVPRNPDRSTDELRAVMAYLDAAREHTPHWETLLLPSGDLTAEGRAFQTRFERWRRAGWLPPIKRGRAANEHELRFIDRFVEATTSGMHSAQNACIEAFVAGAAPTPAIARKALGPRLGLLSADDLGFDPDGMDDWTLNERLARDFRSLLGHTASSNRQGEFGESAAAYVARLVRIAIEQSTVSESLDLFVDGNQNPAEQHEQEVQINYEQFTGRVLMPLIARASPPGDRWEADSEWSGLNTRAALRALGVGSAEIAADELDVQAALNALFDIAPAATAAITTAPEALLPYIALSRMIITGSQLDGLIRSMFGPSRVQSNETVRTRVNLAVILGASVLREVDKWQQSVPESSASLLETLHEFMGQVREEPRSSPMDTESPSGSTGATSPSTTESDPIDEPAC